ncbi:MAG: Rieske (2Fe-2S) protein [Janthinobacterium lividum]
MTAGHGVVLCRLDEIADGGAKGLLPCGNDDTLFAVRQGEAVWVYRNWCPHNGRPLEYRRDRFLSGTGDRIVCYAHGAHFDIRSGHCFHGPCAGRALSAIPVSVIAGLVVMHDPQPDPQASGARVEES